MFRADPKMPVTAYKTYAVQMPRGSHTRPATCAEVDCEHHLKGWKSTIDVTTDLGATQAKYIRLHSGRSFTTTWASESLIVFHFPPGQRCFGEHVTWNGRPALFVARDGDWRGNPTGRRLLHANGQDWIDDFGEHQQRLADAQDRG